MRAMPGEGWRWVVSREGQYSALETTWVLDLGRAGSTLSLLTV